MRQGTIGSKITESELFQRVKLSYIDIIDRDQLRWFGYFNRMGYINIISYNMYIIFTHCL